MKVLGATHGINERFRVLMSELEQVTGKGVEPIVFPDHALHDLTFFAEFDETDPDMLRGPLGFFIARMARRLFRDVHITGIRKGCYVVFFGVDDAPRDEFLSLNEDASFHSLLFESNITLFNGGGNFVLRRKFDATFKTVTYA